MKRISDNVVQSPARKKSTIIPKKLSNTYNLFLPASLDQYMQLFSQVLIKMKIESLI